MQTNIVEVHHAYTAGYRSIKPPPLLIQILCMKVSCQFAFPFLELQTLSNNDY